MQTLLDHHAGKPDVYHVLNAAAGGSPVVMWLKGHKNYGRTYARMMKNYVSENAEKLEGRPPPTVAFCQQFLQGAFGDRRVGIEGPEDNDRIRLGADTFFRLAEQFREDGMRIVYIAAHIYKKPMEPEIGNERLALRALLDCGHDYIRSGPDVWEPMRDAFPSGFSAVDKVHLCVSGARIMAELWYLAIASTVARDEVIRMMHAEPFPDFVKTESKRKAGRARRLKARQEREANDR